LFVYVCVALAGLTHPSICESTMMTRESNAGCSISSTPSHPKNKNT
jgi:hypothetical protein